MNERGPCPVEKFERPWIVPFWMLLALAGMFLRGLFVGSFLTWVAMIGPFVVD
jgi:hypothetical protein